MVFCCFCCAEVFNFNKSLLEGVVVVECVQVEKGRTAADWDVLSQFIVVAEFVE